MGNKKTLLINGKMEEILFDAEKDSLADALRAHGLIGTKVGCGKGMCGACNVILDGKLIRSCTKKMRTVDEGASVVTIEGIGTLENMHPLQLAWIRYGSVQCGFCTPGFIVSAKALLDENPSPTRKEVRDWFQKHRNACRCTGYRPLVDAVMAAAAVMRGELSAEELLWTEKKPETLLGSDFPRPDAAMKVTGLCEYGDDIEAKSEDLVHLAVVMPNVSHGNILSIDTSEAEAAEGVLKVITYKDIPGTNRINLPVGSPRSKAEGDEREILCEKKVYRDGDILALVAADTKQHAREAAALVRYNIEELPNYTGAMEAIQKGAVEIHPGIPNLFLDHPIQKGEYAGDVIANSKYSVKGSFYSTRQPHLPIEPETGQAYPLEDGSLTIKLKSHGLYLMRDVVAESLGMDPEKIRIVLNPCGGAFGYALSVGFPALLGAAALAVGKPVSLTMSYEEHQRYTGKRAASYSNGAMACDENGKLTATSFEFLYDKGTYTEFAGDLADVALIFFGVPYYTPNVSGVAKVAFSNQPFSTAYRGFGSPQVFTASEQLIDMLAEKAGIDPLEMRYINAYREGDTGNTGNEYKVHPVPGILDALRPVYQRLVEDAKRNSTQEYLRGVGVSMGSFKVGDPFDYAEVDLELNEDGSVTNYNTWEEIGQGSTAGALMQTFEALRPLGLSLDQIHLIMNDTALCPDTGMSASSRGNYFHGRAVIEAANQLIAAMQKPDGTYRTYSEMVAEGIPTRYKGVIDMTPSTTPLSRIDGQGDVVSDYSYSAYVAEVEVETATGKVRVLEMHCVADVGTVTNRLSLEGQAFGGMSHCIGFALGENYTDSKKHGTMIGAGFPYIETIPDDDKFTVTFNETKRPLGPWGAGGASESFQSGGHVSVLNAIANATGIRVYDLPATPEKIKGLMEAKQRGEDIAPAPYPIENDLKAYLQDCRDNPAE